MAPKRARGKEPATAPEYPPLFISSKFISRTVTPSIYVDLPFFIRENFQFAHWIETQNLTRLVTLKRDYCPTVIRAFYTNMKYDENLNLFGTEIRGKHIGFNEEQLAHILNLPIPSANAYRITDQAADLVKNILGYSKENIIVALTNREFATAGTKIAANELSIDLRLLHYIIAHILMPKTGNLAYPNDCEMCLMHCIKEGKEVNFPYLIMKRMSIMANRTSGPLPYASCITKILQHFHVEWKDHDKVEPKLLGENNMTRLGFIRNEGGEWEKKHASAAPPAREPDMQDVLDQEGNEGSSSNNSQILTMLQNMQDKMTERFNLVDANIQELSDNLDFELGTLKDKMSTLERAYMGQL